MAKEVIPQFARDTGRYSSWGNRAKTRSREAMMTSFVSLSNQMAEEDTMEAPISAREEDNDDEYDQESEEEELAIPKPERRMSHAAEESLALDALPPDAQTLVHEWFAARDASGIPKSYHEDVAEIGQILRQREPPGPSPGLAESLA
jgi:hypothetical protein